MKNGTNISFKQLPTSYRELAAFHMPRPIHDDVEYENTVEVVDALAVAGDRLNRDQRDYLEILTQLVESYDTANVAEPKRRSAAEALRFLLEQNEMSVNDLGKLLGVDRSVVYRILKGTRKLTLDHVLKLKKRFRVSADLFA